jgi:DNA-binding CsgD family transcriptional regulator
VSFPSLSGNLPLLVGREREVALLRQHLAAATQGRGSMMLIGGEAGVGKSALAAALCREAAEQSILVLVGHCYDLSETPPYGPWVELFGRYRRADGMPPLPGAFAQRGTIGQVASQAALFQQVADFLVAVAATRPLLLLLEDLHWADPGSLDLLRFVARSLGDLHLLLLVTYRSEEVAQRHPLSPLLPVLVREAQAGRFDLQPFDTDAVRKLVVARYPLPEADATRLVDYLCNRGEGNALFVGELLHALEETDVLRPAGEHWTLGPLSGTGVPPLLWQLIGGRASRLGGESQRLLAVAAVIGQEIPLDVWTSVTGADEDRLLEVVSEAEAAHLMVEQPDGSGATFTHALVRETLYESVRPSQRRHWHRRVGEVLAALPHADPDAVASHFQRAGDSRVLAWLRKAADRAQHAYAWLTAADRLDAALAVMDAQGSNAAERGWLLFRLAALRFYERPTLGVALLDEAIQAAERAGDRVLAAFAQFCRGYHRFTAGEHRQALVEMEAGAAALDALPPADQERLRTILASGTYVYFEDPRGTLALHLAHVGRFAEAAARAAPLLTEAERAADAGTDDDVTYVDLYAALLPVHTSFGRPAEAQRAAERARAGYEAMGHRWQAGLIAYRELAWVIMPYLTDALAVREAVAAATVAAWQEVSRVQPHVLPQGARLPLLFLEGEWDEAGRIADAVLTRRVYASAQYHPTMESLLLARGETERGWAMVDAELPEGPATAPGGGYFRLGLAAQHLAVALSLEAGELATAKEWLDAADAWLGWAGGVLGASEQQVLWAQYHRQIDDDCQAYACAERALALARAPRQPLALLAAHRLLGELDTEAGRFETAASHFDAALQLADACRAPYERALTLLARAALHAAMDERDEAVRLLDAVRAIGEPLGAQPTLARTDALARRLVDAPARRPPMYPAGLTAREVEILRFVAAGHTSRAIAEQLFLSVATVNNHVAHILTKTDTATRAEAVAFAQRHGLL